MHYVILGNGVAGMAAALALRRREAEASLPTVARNTIAVTGNGLRDDLTAGSRSWMGGPGPHG